MGIPCLIVLLLFGSVAVASDGEKQESVRVYTNEDLPPPSPESKVTLADETDPTLPPLTYGTFRDRHGHDEAWWRERVASLEAEILEARRELELLSQMIPRCSPIFELYWLCGRSEVWQVWLEYEKAAIRVEELEAMREQLKEEARTAGALPGWLR